MERPKIVCLHIGTHKTGTTTLQTFFAVNRPWFAAAGVYVPLAGRYMVANGSTTPGHHAIAWDFTGSDTSSHFESTIDEVQRVAAPVVLLTSEEFHPLYERPNRLRTMVEGFASIGYATKILVYLRDQPHYAESLFGEYNKTVFVGRFERYLDSIIAHGTYAPPGYATTIAFEYTRMLSAFAEVAGSENIVARPYVSTPDPEYLLRDFLTVIARFRGGLNLQGFGNPLPMENPSASFGELLAHIYESAVRKHGARAPDPAALLRRDFPSTDERLLAERYRLITRDESLRMLARFYDDNIRVRDEFGCAIPFLSEGDIEPAGIALWEDTARQREILSHAIARWGLD